jgi:peptide methionine sulfoxide reductase MsrB
MFACQHQHKVFFMHPARLIAAAAKKHIFKGDPCKKGHGKDRYTINGRCVTCTKEASVNQNRRVRELLAQASEQG